MSLLATILQQKRAEIANFGSEALPTPPARRRLTLARPPGEPLRLITEIKRRSPSAGPLSTALSVGERARAYERAGSSMVSVLTDGTFFDGAYEHLREARASTSLPLLCKDFILDPRQLERARAFGADAALLIVRCLDDRELRSLIQAARALDLEPLVEVTTENEAAQALGAGATFIGVNARDLDTLVMDLPRARRVLESMPRSIVRAHLSGIGSPEAVSELASTTVDAALIGEVLMREDQPEELLRRLRRAC